MLNSGPIVMSIGQGSGENRVQTAINAAVKPQLRSLPMEGAKRIIFNIAGKNLTLFEIARAADLIKENTDDDAIVYWGYSIKEELNEDEIWITIVASGFTTKAKPEKKQVTFDEYDFS